MPLYVVTYTHPDSMGWQAHLMAHIHYLQDLLAEGVLQASGPFKDKLDRPAMLILRAENRDALDEIIARDPFAREGLIQAMTVTEWDPIFGAFNAHSSMPGQLQSR